MGYFIAKKLMIGVGFGYDNETSLSKQIQTLKFQTLVYQIV